MRRTRLKPGKPLQRRSFLKAKKPLTRRTWIKPISDKELIRKQQRQKLRQQLLRRANGKCEHCGGQKDFRGWHMHHLEFLSHQGEDTPENCQIWCAPCHYGEDGHNHNEVESEPMWNE